jgi:hypothetical protein
MSGNNSSLFLDVVFFFVHMINSVLIFFVHMINSVLMVTIHAGGAVIQLISPFKGAWDSILSPLPGIGLWTEDNSKLKDDIARLTAEVSKLKDDISSKSTAEISKLEDEIATKISYTDVMAEIAKLKDEIATTRTAEISKLKDDMASGLTAEREEIKSLDQFFKQYKEDEALLKLSTFALINPRPIFPSLPPEAFTASSSWRGDSLSPTGVPWKVLHTPSMCLLHKASKRQELCWHAADESPNSFIQVNLGQLYLVSEIQTRGRGESTFIQWTKNYKVGYVHHEQNVEVALRNLHDGDMFDGNYGVTEIASNKYFKPFIAQYIKLYPLEFQERIVLNWEVIGVPLSKIDEKGLKMFLLTSSEKSVTAKPSK